MKRKGVAYAIETIIVIFIILVFGIGGFDVAAGEEWGNYQNQIASSDLGYVLQKTGHLNRFLKNSDLQSLKATVRTVSDTDMEISGTVYNLPIRDTEVGFYTSSKRLYYENLRPVQPGDTCYGDLADDAVSREADEGPVYRTDGGLTARHGVTLYLSDTDALTDNQRMDLDRLWVDNGTSCQFDNVEGPFDIGEFFMWGDATTPAPENHYSYKENRSRGIFHRADQVLRMKEVTDQRLNGIRTEVNYRTFNFSTDGLGTMDVMVFREDSSLPEINANSGELKDLMRNTSVLLAMDLQKSDFSSGFIPQTGLEWSNLNFSTSSPNTTCPTRGDVVISSDCTLGPGTYHYDSLTVTSGAEIRVKNNLRRCDSSQGGVGCSSVPYSKYAPQVFVENRLEVYGTINASMQGFRYGGPGAGGDPDGGAGYGGVGGGAGGGPSYGQPSRSRRVGSAGGGPEGGRGGGSVWITTNQEMVLDGEIVARGGDGNSGSGGGSGGSVRLQADTLSGSGLVSVNGGDSLNPSGTPGGGGAGGRVLMVRRSGGLGSISVTRSGGSGSSDGGQGTFYDVTRDFPMPGISYSSLEASDQVNTYTVGQGYSYRNLSLVPAGKVSSNMSRFFHSRNVIAYTPLQRYRLDQWNATNMGLSWTSNPPPGAPPSECNEYKEGVIDFPADGRSTGVYILSAHLGNCFRDVWGIKVDTDGDGSLQDQETKLNGDRLVVRGKRYNVNIYITGSCNGGCIDLGYNGSERVEVVNYRTSFRGFQGERLARVSYENPYEPADRRLVSSLIYWLSGQQYGFESGYTGAQQVSSTKIFGALDKNVFMPYRIELRWQK
ncbi:MAG: hypothetical protein ABEK01_02560 [Candidatus Nanohaloarchaea archaeon]